MHAFFFDSSRAAHSQHTALYDFVWPTATAMWNLRWQVGGYLNAVPGAKDTQLKARFAEGADIDAGNLKRACIDHTWEQQKEAFAHILLVNTIANYEGWIESILGELKITSKVSKTLQTPLQLPGTNGVHYALTFLTKPSSPLMEKCVHLEMVKSKYYALPKLEAMMKCYRFFKEIRNCIMHKGSIADNKMEKAYKEFLPVSKPLDLGLSEVPKHYPITVSKPVQLSLRGVVGFSHVILKIIATIDAELTKSPVAEDILYSRWKAVHNIPTMLPGDTVRKSKRLSQMARRANVLPISQFGDLASWLKAKGLIIC